MIELSFAVRAADKFRISTPDAEKARALLEKYVEERMDPKTKRDLESAKTSMDRAKLEEVLAVCDKEGYVTSLVRECRQLLSQIEDVMQQRRCHAIKEGRLLEKGSGHVRRIPLQRTACGGGTKDSQKRQEGEAGHCKSSAAGT